MKISDKVYTWVFKSDASIFCPKPVFILWINAAIIAPWQYKPVEMSVKATPGFAGGSFLNYRH